MQAVEHTIEIDVDHLAPLLRGHLVDIGAILDGGAEHGGIEPRIFPPHVVDERGDGGFVRNVDLCAGRSGCARRFVKLRSRRSWLRSTAMTVAPSRAQCRASAAPMPLPAPVIRMTAVVEPVGDRDRHAGTASRCGIAERRAVRGLRGARDIGWIAATWSSGRTRTMVSGGQP